MTNDPAAIAWLEDQFEKQFRPGGGQRLTIESIAGPEIRVGERGEEVFRTPAPPLEPPMLERATWRALADRAVARYRRFR